MHEHIEPLARLIGTWRGAGVVSYPTMRADVAYTEETTFAEIGKPFLVYTQRTWSESGQPMHTESGYLRSIGDQELELVVAHPTGQSELGSGEFTPGKDALFISTDAEVRNTATAKRVDRIVRSLAVRGDTLIYDMAMAMAHVGLTRHLHAELTRS